MSSWSVNKTGPGENRNAKSGCMKYAKGVKEKLLIAFCVLLLHIQKPICCSVVTTCTPYSPSVPPCIRLISNNWWNQTLYPPGSKNIHQTILVFSPTNGEMAGCSCLIYNLRRPNHWNSNDRSTSSCMKMQNAFFPESRGLIQRKQISGHCNLAQGKEASAYKENTLLVK